IGVGKVGVEGGIDDIEPGAHAGDAAAAVSEGGRVAELVEGGGGDDHTEDGEHKAGGVEGLVETGAEAVDEKQPVLGASCEGENGDEDRRPKEDAQAARE